MPIKRPLKRGGVDFLYEVFYSVAAVGSAGVTYTVLLFVKITMPGFAPAGFETNLTSV